MGLDMWFEEIKRTEIHYWRKHNALHNWFAKKAIAMGLVETEADFNVVPVPLTLELLAELEADIRNGNLEPTEGFFFGGTDYDPKEDMEDDLKAIRIAREIVESGGSVQYNSWW
jgi:hypothetical protein